MEFIQSDKMRAEESILHETKMNCIAYEMPIHKPSTPPYNNFEDDKPATIHPTLPSHQSLQECLGDSRPGYKETMQEVIIRVIKQDFH